MDGGPGLPGTPGTAVARVTAERVAAPETLAATPVATPALRFLAAVLDLGMVVLAVGLIALILSLGLGNRFLGDESLLFFVYLGGFLTIMYKLFWAVAGTESPGLQWAQLRLVTFDGTEPTREDRLRRLAWSCVSILPGALGLIWTLADEETLSWHDHSSKTFLSPYTPQESR